MPTYYRPKVAHIEPGGADPGGLVPAAAAIAAAAAVVVFIIAHLVLLAVVAGVFVAVMAAVAVAFRKAASARKWAEYRYPEPPVRVTAARPAQALPAPPPAIEAPGAIRPAVIPGSAEHVR